MCRIFPPESATVKYIRLWLSNLERILQKMFSTKLPEDRSNSTVKYFFPEDFERLFALLKRIISFTLNVENFVFLGKQFLGSVSIVDCINSRFYCVTWKPHFSQELGWRNDTAKRNETCETTEMTKAKRSKQNEPNDQNERPIWPKNIRKITRGRI